MASAPILTLPLTTIRGISTIEQSTIETRYRRGVKYLAEITGPDPKFGLARRFLRRVSTRTHDGSYFSIAGFDRAKLIEFGFDDKSKRYGIVTAITSSTITFDEIPPHEAAAIASTMGTEKDPVPGQGFSSEAERSIDDEGNPSTTEIVAGIFEGDEGEREPSERLASAQDIESFRNRFKRRIS